MYTRHPAKTDEEILASYPRGKQDRVRIELEIVNAIIERAAKLGYTLRVFANGDEYEECGSYDVKTALFDSIAPVVDVEDAQGERIGFIALVFGNEGWDLVSDYGPVGTEDDQPWTPMEDFIYPICKLAESLA